MYDDGIQLEEAEIACTGYGWMRESFSVVEEGDGD